MMNSVQAIASIILVFMLKNWVEMPPIPIHHSLLVKLVSALNLRLQKYDKFVRKVER